MPNYQVIPQRFSKKLMNKEKIDLCIDIICHKGCKNVRSDIISLENGKNISEIEELTLEESKIVLKELKDIMDVYKSRCTI